MISKLGTLARKKGNDRREGLHHLVCKVNKHVNDLFAQLNILVYRESVPSDLL